MKPSPRSAGFAFVATLALAMNSRAALAPYTVDANTLHLWHLDESATPCIDAVVGGTNLTSLAGGATLSNPSFPGFGTALNTIDGGQTATSASGKNALLSALPLVDGPGDNVLTPFANPTTGAFTFEAIVHVNFNPAFNMSGTGRAGMQIISGEGDDSDGASGRLFQWRIDPVGLGSGDTTVPRLHFINLHKGVSIQDIVVMIPTNGPDAIISNQWYHVAVTYNGAENTVSNILFYWTLMDTNRTQANLIGAGDMVDDLSANVATDFVIANEGRAVGSALSTDNFIGLVDEVRISSIVRSATNFLFIPTDSDGDGLPDAWEMQYFHSLVQGATNDPDGDGFSNLQEYLAGSNPTNSLSTPLDTDADGLPDAWEMTYFGTLAYGAGDDPDGDGYSNLQEYIAGTNPNDAASNPGDTDMDGLPDAWEMTYFGTLAYGANDDPDGDGFSNLAEYLAGTNPNDAQSIPFGVATRLVPIDDGNTNTSEYGYAGDVDDPINTVAFICSGLRTVGNQQFITYYGRHQTDASYAFNNKIWIGRRTVGSNVWEVFRTSLAPNDINDGHDVISFGIDGNGYMHLSWGMHGNSFLYTKSLTSVLGTNAIAFGPTNTMTGAEGNVTYPQFLTMPNGDLLFIFREGSSGSGDTFINRYDHLSQTWTNQQYNAGQKPFIKGTGWTPDYNCYPNMPCLDTNGNLFFVWVWREDPAYQSNHDFSFAKSTNGGITWLRSDNTPYALPISAIGENGDPNTVAERVLTIPQGSSIINQAGMCLDQSGWPVAATWWAPGTPTNNFQRQYMVIFHTTDGWAARQVSQRTIDPPGTLEQDGVVRDLGRPVVVTDSQDRIIVLYRDNQGANGLTIVHSLPKAVDPDRLIWTTFDLTTNNFGSYEPVIDQTRWARDNNLHILYQPVTGHGYTAPANTASPVGVLEWNAAAYFKQSPALHLMLTNENQNVLISFHSQPSWGYRLWSATNFTDWNAVGTSNGTGGDIQFVQTNGVDPKRFWRLELKEGGF